MTKLPSLPTSFDPEPTVIDGVALDRVTGGANWVKIGRAARDAALELWSGAPINRIPPPRTPPKIEWVDPRGAPKPPEIPGVIIPPPKG